MAHRKLTISFPEDIGKGKLFQMFTYPAGEVQVRLTSEGIKAVKEATAYEIITHSVFDIVALAQLVDAIDGVNPLITERSLFAAYLPYARADRRFVEGDCFGFRRFMRLLRMLDFTSIWTFDAHNAELTGKHNIVNILPTYEPVDQLRKIILDIEGLKKNGKGTALILPDEGAVKRYGYLTQYNRSVIVGRKVRNEATGELTGFDISKEIANYDRALIVDDICDGGGTFVGLGKKIKEYAPNIKLYLYVSHGIFSKGLGVLKPVFENVFISDYSFIGPETNSEDWVTI